MTSAIASRTSRESSPNEYAHERHFVADCTAANRTASVEMTSNSHVPSEP